MTGSVFSPPHIAQSVELELLSIPSTAALTRRLVREWYRHWSLPQHVITGAELVMSELVTNVITRAKSRTMRIRIRWSWDSGFIEVWDADPAPPIEQNPGEAASGGWGLVLVSTYAARWSYYPSEGGKVVWAELTLANIEA
jgi:anti-sigma regulatory factor (Ser/Thr protein kinase)